MRNEFGKVVLRVVFGLVFFIHGLSKFQDGITNTVEFFNSLGVPGFIAYVVAVVELLGGIAIILGLGTRIINVIFALIMMGAIFTAKLSTGFLGGYEFEIVLLAISVYFIFADKSQLSLDKKLSKEA